MSPKLRSWCAVAAWSWFAVASLSSVAAVETAVPPAVAVAASVSGGRADENASAVSDLLGARLAADPRWSLVERSRLQALERELALSAGGFASAATAVRQGRLAHADLVLTCQIRETSDTSGEAVLALVDAQRSVRFGTETVVLGERPAGAWLRSPPVRDVEAMTTTARRLLESGAARWTRDLGRATIAPLAIRFSARTEWREGIAVRWRAALERHGASRNAVVLDLQATEATLDEGLLGSAGLTDLSDQAWIRVADVYLWGRVSVSDVGRDKPSGAQIKIIAWNGTGEPQKFEQRADWDKVDAAFEAAAGHVVAQLSGRADPSPEARRRIAKLLLAEATNGGESDFPFVDAAAFFAPDDVAIQVKRVAYLHHVVSGRKPPVDLSREHARLIRAFWRRPNGDIDLPLLEDQFRYLKESAETHALIREIAEGLHAVPESEVARLPSLFLQWMHLLDRPVDLVAARETFEKIWPTARLVMAETHSPGVTRPSPHAELMINRLYVQGFDAATAARGRRLLAGEGVPRRGGGAVRHLVAAAEAPPPVAAKTTGPQAAPASEMNAIGRATLQRRLYSVSWQANQLAVLRQLLSQGADPLAVGPENESAFQRAFTQRQWENAAEMAAGLDPNLPFPIDRTRSEPVGGYALHAALAAGNFELALQLLDRGARPTKSPIAGVGDSAAILALKSRRTDLIERMLQAGAVPTFGDQPLHWLVDQHDAALLRRILQTLREQKSPLNPLPRWLEEPDAGDRTPLWLAAQSGWKEGVEILLAAGAGTDPKVYSGRKLIEDAVQHPEVMVLLNGRPSAPDNQLAGAVAVAMIVRGDPALETLPIDSAVLRYADLRGSTVLHRACWHKRIGFVRRLIAAGANLDAKNSVGSTPLQFSANMGQVEIAALLIAAGAKVNLANSDGTTPLHWAAISGDPATIRCLLKAGADPTRPGFDNGETAVATAANRPTALAAFRVFLELGVPLQTRDHYGFGTLEHAVNSDEPEAIQFLLDHGVTWNRPWPSEEYHPLKDAVTRAKTRSVRKLLELGLYDDRALGLTKNAEVRAMLEDASRNRGSRAADDAELWPAICEDLEHGAARAQEHVARGGNVNFVGRRWTPLWLAVKSQNVPLVRFLVANGAKRDWYPAGEEGAPVFAQLIRIFPRDGTTFEQNDRECAEIARLMVTHEQVRNYEWILGAAVRTGMNETVKAMLDAGVPTEFVVKELILPGSEAPEKKQEMLRMLGR